MKIMEQALVHLKHKYPEIEYPYDINDGLCDQWAEFVCAHLSGAEMRWIDELAPRTGGWYQHCVVVYRGKLYDAEALNGVDSWKHIPLVLNQKAKRTRERVVQTQTRLAEIAKEVPHE